MMYAIRSCCVLVLLSTATGVTQKPAEDPTQAPKGAPIDSKAFRYSRSIEESPPGLSTVALDAAVLAHSRSDLGDLRIADDNHQIPYLLDTRRDVLSLDLTLIPDKAPGSAAQSHYLLNLPFENLPQAKLALTTTERTFERNVSITVKRPPLDPRSEARPETVASAVWRHSDPETPAPSLTLDLTSGLETRSATLTVDEGDNRPL